ncbi:MAG: hypothetical protein Q4G63_00415 [Bacteroidia bacterium]|nr:hypothetical protein [Bacteroidia bacterium]
MDSKMKMHVSINTNTVSGRRLIKEIAKNPNSVEILKPAPTNEKIYTVNEVYHHGMKKLSELYGVDMYKFEEK